MKAEFGTVDALFANAGVNGFAPFEATSEELFDQLLAINAKGPYFTVQKLAPLLAEGSGVVFTTSVANVLGLPMLSAYAAGKAALRSMTRSLARELLPRKIRVNAVSPGPIDSGILEKSMPKEAAEQAKTQMAADNPSGAVGPRTGPAPTTPLGLGLSDEAGRRCSDADTQADTPGIQLDFGQRLLPLPSGCGPAWAVRSRLGGDTE